MAGSGLLFQRMKTILIEIISPHTLCFFTRLAAALARTGATVHFATSRLDLHVRARASGYPVFLIRRHAPDSATPDLTGNPLVRLGAYTPRQASALYASAAGSFRHLHARHAYTHLFIFSGNDISQQGLSATARALGVKTLFFEIGNIEGKTFVDPQGVNARSLLYEKPVILDAFDVRDEDFRQWRDRYLAKKAQVHVIPQARRRRSRRETLEGLRDKLIRATGNITGLTCNAQPAPLRRSIADRLAALRPIALDTVALDASPFLFYPMQVSNDSQVLLNSDMDNIAAIRHVAAIAARQNLRLLVKPHPAEPCAGVLRRVAALRRELGFTLVNNNTFHLLKAASAVFTINSTVGLEALIMGTPVTFLGRSVFAHFNGNRAYLPRYILGYLVDASVFGADPIPETTVHRVLERAGFGESGGHGP